MISVIDMPPPDESIWWRGKRGFEVGFFPCECVEVIGDKLPQNLNLPPAATSVTATSAPTSTGDRGKTTMTSMATIQTSSDEDEIDTQSPNSEPTKPVLRKHGKLISFFRSFILSRPTRGKLKKSGILKERVFGCDLSEHLLNTGQEVPRVLTHCAEFIETVGMIDGIYRLSGIASNIQKLRVAFDEDRVPNLYHDKGVLQDVHSVSSLLKMYFRELPNPLCTYYLYDKFVEAARSRENERLILMREVVQQLPPPNYRTLEYLSRHLYRVSLRGHETGMTAKNVAIVWAPNLLRSKSLEGGGVAALQGVGVQAVVTECLIRYCELIFNDKMPNYNNGRASTSPPPAPSMVPDLKKSRPKSLAISTPTKLLSLEEARNRALAQAAANLGTVAPANGTAQVEPQKYIEVGGGPENLPPKYHTVIDIPNRKPGGSMKQRKSPIGWKSIFSGAKPKPKQIPKISSPAAIDLLTVANNSKLMLDGNLRGTWNRQILRPVKSAESLVTLQRRENVDSQVEDDRKEDKKAGSASRPISGDSDDLAPLETVAQGVGNMSSRRRGTSQKGHERSNSHDSYFERKLSAQFNDEKSYSDTEKMDSSLDLSEIQVNFELEENEMKIFAEDVLSNSLGSDLSKSPLEEKQQLLQQQQQQQQQQILRSPAPKKSPKLSSETEAADDESPKTRSKMSFREKLKRFTSPTPVRQRGDSEVEGMSEPEAANSSISTTKNDPVKRTPSSIREKLVCALSPESLRRRHTHVEGQTLTTPTPIVTSTADVSPKKKKSSFSPGTSPSTNLVKRSKIEDANVVTMASADIDVTTANRNVTATTLGIVDASSASGLQISPSIKFIDSSMHESTDSTITKSLNAAGSSESKPENHRFSTTSSTDDEACQVNQLVEVQVHHQPIFESQFENDLLYDEDSDDLVTQPLAATSASVTATTTTAPTTPAPSADENLMTSFKRDFAQKFSMNSQTSFTSGEKTPSELSVSIAGATVSENESFSVLSIDEDQIMSSVPEPSFPSTKLLPHQSVIHTEEAAPEKIDQAQDHRDWRQDHQALAQNRHDHQHFHHVPRDWNQDHQELHQDLNQAYQVRHKDHQDHHQVDNIISRGNNQERKYEVLNEEIEAMEIDEAKVTPQEPKRNVENDVEVENMDVDDVANVAKLPMHKNRFEYRPLSAKETSSNSSLASASASSRSSVSEDSDVAVKAAKSDTSSASSSSTSSCSTSASEKSSERWVNDKSDEKPLLQDVTDEKSATKSHVATAELYPKQTSRFTLHVGADMDDGTIEQEVEKSVCQTLPDCQNQEEDPKSPKDSSVAKPDFTIRTFGPQPYTRKDISAPAQPIVQFEMESDDCVVDLRRSYGGFRNSSGRFTLPNTEQFKSKFESSKVEAMDEFEDGEARSISLPYVPTEHEFDGRKSSQGIPEVEKKLSFAEPSLTKVPSDGVIVKAGKKLSTFSLHSAEGADISGSGANEELPLQRRNSIHNVPYVDVNDPATRERMERYKEERRSMLRAKYRVEDYREKPPMSPTTKGATITESRRSVDESSMKKSPEKSVDNPATSSTSTTPSSTATSATTSTVIPVAASVKTSAETTSPILSRFRKMTPVESIVDKITNEKSPKIERNSISKSPEMKQPEMAQLRKLPVDKPTTKSSPSQTTSKQANETAETPRKWTSSSRTSLNSFDNKKVSVAIIEPDVTLRKVATLKTDVIVPPTPQKPVPTVIPSHNDLNLPAKTRSTRVSCPADMVDDDVNVRERAAIFNTAAAHRANQAELRTKFVSLIPQNNDESKSRKGAGIGKHGGPGSPNKIKNIAAMFEQKT